MKIQDPLEGVCKHKIPKKDHCEKCWDAMVKDSGKKTEAFLKAIDRAEKRRKKSKLMFDRG